MIKKAWAYTMSGIAVLMLLIILITPMDSRTKTIMLLATIGFLILLGGMAFLITKLVVKVMQKGIIIPEPIETNRISFHELYSEALKINDSDLPWFVEPHEEEGWIDVTWKWKDSQDLQGLQGINKNEEVFYKLFKVYDDYTYEDLDMVTSKNYILSSSPALSSEFAIGHTKQKQYRAVIGNDESGFGIHQYTIDTNELTNFMHSWFAQHGYRYRGLM